MTLEPLIALAQRRQALGNVTLQVHDARHRLTAADLAQGAVRWHQEAFDMR